MSISDPIADMATLIRNASFSGKEKVDIKASKINEEILKILKKEKFILNYKAISEDKQGRLRVYLKFDERRKPAITNIKKVSKPGIRVYRKSGDIRPVMSGIGISIVTTSWGILADKEVREKNIGGEILLEVW